MIILCYVVLSIACILYTTTTLAIIDDFTGSIQVTKRCYLVNSASFFLLIIMWAILDNHGRYQWEYNTKTINVVKLDGASVAMVDGKLVNLNEVFKKNFSENKLTVLIPKMKRYGLLWPEPYKLNEIKLVE